MSATLFLVVFTMIAFAENLIFNSQKYSITYPETFNGIEEVSIVLSGLNTAIDSFFRFNNLTNVKQQKIVICSNKQSFNEYLLLKLGQTRNTYTFLKYSNPEQSELVLFLENDKTGYAAFNPSSLNKQIFLQYIYNYVSEPPIWIKDGFQAWFETYISDTKTGLAQQALYLPWLDSAKKILKNSEQRIPISDLISTRIDTFENNLYYPQVWAFVYFLIQSPNNEYQRFLHDSFLLLQYKDKYNNETRQENSDFIRNRLSRYKDFEEADNDFNYWISEQKTFNELVQEGVSLYNTGFYGKSIKILEQALQQKKDNPLVLYYVGLSEFAEKNYTKAKEFYQRSIDSGGEEAPALWALGLTYYAEKNFIQARIALEKAVLLSPEKYKEKAEPLFKSMPN